MENVPEGLLIEVDDVSSRIINYYKPIFKSKLIIKNRGE